MHGGTTIKITLVVIKYFIYPLVKWWGQAVLQLVEALRYKPEGHGFNSR
jgi:hypothetical protein